MTNTVLPAPLSALVERGVQCPDPRQVFVEESICPERIASGVVLHPGTRLSGNQTAIGPGCVLGEEGPVVVKDCRLGHGVRLKGGFFSESVFLDGALMGSAAHVRAGTLLEEQAEGAHAVGFKQTILFPFVVTGSLVNFCDILMAGGTSRRDHSEVGSSYIHFNFTPYGDKATASLVGDVPRGVLLDQPRIFLGGQGGLVGPVRIAFGTVIPAGRVHRGDITEPGLLVAAEPLVPPETRPFRSGAGRAPERLIENNLRFIGNLRALRAWYRHVRRPLFESDAHRAWCLEGAVSLLRAAIEERVLRLEARMAIECVSGSPCGLLSDPSVWPAFREALLDDGIEETAAEDRDAFLATWPPVHAADGYLAAVHALSAPARAYARRWLDALVAAALPGLPPAGHGSQD